MIYSTRRPRNHTRPRHPPTNVQHHVRRTGLDGQRPDRHRAEIRSYRFLLVRGVKSFGEGSGFAAAVFRGVVTPPRSLSGVTTFAVSIGIWLMAAPEFDKGTLARTLIGPCGQVRPARSAASLRPPPLVKFLHSHRGGKAGQAKACPACAAHSLARGHEGRARIRWTCARAPVAWSAGSCPGAWSWTGRAAAVGWVQVREWLGRRAGVRGVSRPRWRQSRSPGALPGPPLRRRGGRRPSGAGRRRR